jgi:YggT family protein
MKLLILLVIILCRAVFILLFLNFLLSMLLPGDHPVRIRIARIVEVILRPFRKILKPINGIDFSPILAMLVVNLIEWLLTSLIRAMFSA